jgi:glutamate N-acetyltransferase/amino-acid N-acetyltransferase
MNPDRALCKVSGIAVFRNGQPTQVDLARVEAAMKQKDVEILVDLGTGKKSLHRVYTCDLSREYITINADYHT